MRACGDPKIKKELFLLRILEKTKKKTSVSFFVTFEVVCVFFFLFLHFGCFCCFMCIAFLAFLDSGNILAKKTEIPICSIFLILKH